MRKKLLFLIDFLNIVNVSKINGKPKLLNYLLVKEKLSILFPNCKVCAVADPGAPWVIDQKNKYENLHDKGEIIQVGPGEKADYYMLKYLEEFPDCYIISNDGFKEYNLKSQVRDRVIHLCIIENVVFFSEKIEILGKNESFIQNLSSK